jgi:ADP-ribose pyrophosphatase YjhB (NUDIX family)
MADLLPEIRNTARALIIRKGEILLLRKTGGVRGERFALPGGAQVAGETLPEALSRECIEEIDASVSIGSLIYVAEFFKLKDTQPPARQHLVEFLFECHVDDDYMPRNGPRPDKHQVEVVWTRLEAVPSLPLHPRYLADWIPRYVEADRNLYLGTFDDATAS